MNPFKRFVQQSRCDVESEIANARNDLNTAKKSHLDSFAGIESGQKAISDRAKAAKSKIAEISARILGFEETLPDFGNAISKAESEMRSLYQEFTKARREIVKIFLRQVPLHMSKPSELLGLREYVEGGAAIDLNVAMMLYFAAHDVNSLKTRVPFPPDARSPEKFFVFIGHFFCQPSVKDVADFREQFEAMLWGEREPGEAIAIPKETSAVQRAAPSNWDGMADLVPGG